MNIRLAVICLALSLPLPGAAQDNGRLTVELNKLEQGDTGTCRAYFLFRNDTGMTLEGFESSLALMDGEGVIDRLVTVDAAPLPAGRTTLKLFEFPDIQCGAISEMLLYEVGTCKPQNRDEADCFALMELVSKAGVPLVK